MKNYPITKKWSIPFIALLLSVNVASAQKDRSDGYLITAPKGWTVERFSLPPEFAPSLKLKGKEELRLHPDWMKPGKAGNWSYVFLWLLETGQKIDQKSLAQDLEIYYNGLLNRFVLLNKVDAKKIFPTQAKVSLVNTAAGDLATYSAAIMMLSFMSQQPITLNARIHVKSVKPGGKQAVWFQLSPQAPGTPIWKELEAIRFRSGHEPVNKNIK